MDRQILYSLNQPIPSTMRLAVSEYAHPTPPKNRISAGLPNSPSREKKPPLTIIPTKHYDLRPTLTPDPGRDWSQPISYPVPEDLALYRGAGGPNPWQPLAPRHHRQGWASGVKLPSISIVGLGGFLLSDEVFELREYATGVEHGADYKSPAWDGFPCEGGEL